MDATPTEMISDAKIIPLDIVTKQFFLSCSMNFFLATWTFCIAQEKNLVPRKKRTVAKKKFLRQEKKTVFSLYRVEFSWRQKKKSVSEGELKNSSCVGRSGIAVRASIELFI